MTRFAAELELAHELADLADAFTLPAFARGPDSETKADGTWVTETDRGVERAMRKRLAEAVPDHAVLGEEDGLTGAAAAPRWVLDPIDGTTNFVQGNPIFATLIGLQVDGREVLGVVSAPALGTRWDGVADGPARQNGRAIHVSDVRDLAAAEVSLGGLDYFASRGWLDGVIALIGATRRQRGYGDFWQHCLVAAGSTDVAIEAAVNVWDLVAVKVVVEAAGGRFTDLSGAPTPDGGSAVSSNGHLHRAVLQHFS